VRMGLEKSIDEPVCPSRLVARAKHGAVQGCHQEIHLESNFARCAGWLTVTLDTRRRGLLGPEGQRGGDAATSS
jgi:hypothetical protein